MPELAENDGAFGVDGVDHLLPSLHLLLCVYPRALWEPVLQILSGVIGGL